MRFWPKSRFGSYGGCPSGSAAKCMGANPNYPRVYDVATPGGLTSLPPGSAPCTPRGLHLVPPGVSAAGARRQTHGPVNPVHYRPPKTASLTQKRVWAKSNSAIIARLEADCGVSLRKGPFSGLFSAGSAKSWLVDPLATGLTALTGLSASRAP